MLIAHKWLHVVFDFIVLRISEAISENIGIALKPCTASFWNGIGFPLAIPFSPRSSINAPTGVHVRYVRVCYRFESIGASQRDDNNKSVGLSNYSEPTSLTEIPVFLIHQKRKNYVRRLFSFRFKLNEINTMKTQPRIPWTNRWPTAV